MRKLLAALLAVMLPLAGFANGLIITNRSDLASSNSNSLRFVVSITGTNPVGDVVSNLVGYVGSSDGGQVPAMWGLSYDLGTNVVGTVVTQAVYGILPSKTYWFSTSVSGSASGTVWASRSGQIVTADASTGGATGNPLAIAATGASLTNVAWHGATTNFAFLATLMSNVVNQLSIINSNQHRLGYP